MLNLLNSPLFSSESFIENSVELYDVVMLTQADGDYFTFYSKMAEYFELLNKSLENTVQFIEESSWYKENSSTLSWDEEYSMCLISNKLK